MSDIVYIPFNQESAAYVEKHMDNNTGDDAGVMTRTGYIHQEGDTNYTVYAIHKLEPGYREFRSLFTQGYAEQKRLNANRVSCSTLVDLLEEFENPDEFKLTLPADEAMVLGLRIYFAHDVLTVGEAYEDDSTLTKATLTYDKRDVTPQQINSLKRYLFYQNPIKINTPDQYVAQRLNLQSFAHWHSENNPDLQELKVLGEDPDVSAQTIPASLLHQKIWDESQLGIPWDYAEEDFPKAIATIWSDGQDILKTFFEGNDGNSNTVALADFDNELSRQWTSEESRKTMRNTLNDLRDNIQCFEFTYKVKRVHYRSRVFINTRNQMAAIDLRPGLNTNAHIEAAKKGLIDLLEKSNREDAGKLIKILKETKLVTGNKYLEAQELGKAWLNASTQDQVKLGELLYEGREVQQDKLMALTVFHYTAKKDNDPTAQFYMGLILDDLKKGDSPLYDINLNGVSLKDTNRMDPIYWYEEAAKQGHTTAQYLLGLALLDNDKAEDDERDGRILIIGAGNAGSPAALLEMEKRYRDTGDGHFRIQVDRDRFKYRSNQLRHYANNPTHDNLVERRAKEEMYAYLNPEKHLDIFGKDEYGIQTIPSALLHEQLLNGTIYSHSYGFVQAIDEFFKDEEEVLKEFMRGSDGNPETISLEDFENQLNRGDLGFTSSDHELVQQVRDHFQAPYAKCYEFDYELYGRTYRARAFFDNYALGEWEDKTTYYLDLLSGIETPTHIWAAEEALLPRLERITSATGYPKIVKTRRPITSNNYFETRELYRQSLAGSPKAQMELGEMFEKGNKGLQQDRLGALILYMKAAHHGNDPAAQFKVGMMLKEYNEFENKPRFSSLKELNPDFVDPTYWYQRAADQGHPTAKFFLGLALRSNEDTKDDKEGWDLVREAAYMGSTAAQYRVANGYLYHDSNESQKEGMRWLTMALLNIPPYDNEEEQTAKKGVQGGYPRP